MRRPALLAPLVLAAAAAALVACGPSTTTAGDATTGAPLAARHHPTTTAAPLPPGTLAGDPIGSGPVQHVTDGDTIHVLLNGVATDVRIIGLDTPETVKPGYAPACFGPQASANAHRLFDGQTVTLRRDPTQAAHDRYGRTLAYVTEPDGRTDYSLDAVAQGFGRADQVGRAPQEWAALTAAQAGAQAAHAGLWGACGGTFPFPTPKPHPTTTAHPSSSTSTAGETATPATHESAAPHRTPWATDPHQSTNDPWVAGQLAWCRAGHDGVPPSEC